MLSINKVNKFNALLTLPNQRRSQKRALPANILTLAFRNNWIIGR